MRKYSLHTINLQQTTNNNKRLTTNLYTVNKNGL